jgi:F0F1-type ATP synthase membrane subunit b/b'
MAGTANAGASTASNGGDGGVKEQAQEKAQEVREQAGEQVRKATGQARDRARDQVDQRSTQAGDQVHQHAGDLRDVAQQLREQGKDGPAKIADQVAERAERAGSWMKESDADRILSDVEDFARSNPWAVAAGGLALGFVASRVLKASSSQRYEQRSGTASTAGTAGQLPPAGGTTPAPPVATPGASDPLAAPTTPVVDDPLRMPTRGGGL